MPKLPLVSPCSVPRVAAAATAKSLGKGAAEDSYLRCRKAAGRPLPARGGAEMGADDAAAPAEASPNVRKHSKQT